jgi:hypothetical protein
LIVNYWRVNVVLYSAIEVSFLALIIYGAIFFYSPIFKSLGNFEKIQNILICGLLGYVFAISLPTVIDRSLSFYILEKLEQRGGGIKREDFEYVFTHEYVKEHRLVDIRLTEQVESGTILIDGGCVKLTPKGELVVRFSHYFRKNLLPKNRLIGDTYTDALIDPFINSVKPINYTCN